MKGSNVTFSWLDPWKTDRNRKKDDHEVIKRE